MYRLRWRTYYEWLHFMRDPTTKARNRISEINPNRIQSQSLTPVNLNPNLSPQETHYQLILAASKNSASCYNVFRQCKKATTILVWNSSRNFHPRTIHTRRSLISSCCAKQHKFLMPNEPPGTVLPICCTMTSACSGHVSATTVSGMICCSKHSHSGAGKSEAF